MESQEHLFLSVNEGYNRWSEFYDRDDIPLHLLEEKIVDEVLGDVQGVRILDLACGTGRQTVRLAERGAVITGVDQSQGMLEKAKAKKELEFLHFDLNARFQFANEAFDRVVSFLALEHFTELPQFFSECGRVCRTDGFLFFTAMHPAMVLRGVQARYTEESGRKVYPKSFPYQISDYLNAAIDAGLVLARLTEHTPAGPCF